MYLYKTRLGNVFRFLQFFGGEILPFTLLTFLVLNSSSLNAILSLNFGYFFLLAAFLYLTFFTLYEAGYIINDCVATKFESNPSIRYVDNVNWKYLVSSKLFFFALLVALGSVFFQINGYFFITYGSLTMMLFLIHNRLPLQERGFSYFWLELMRLMLLPFLLLISSGQILIMFLLIIPELLRRTLRYMRIKSLSSDRKFSFFDLKVSLISVFMVCIFLSQFDITLIPVILMGYAIIMAGMLYSISVHA